MSTVTKHSHKWCTFSGVLHGTTVYDPTPLIWTLRRIRTLDLPSQRAAQTTPNDPMPRGSEITPWVNMMWTIAIVGSLGYIMCIFTIKVIVYMFTFMYIYEYIYICTCMFLCGIYQSHSLSITIYLCVYIYTVYLLSIYICLSVYLSVCMYVCLYVCMYRWWFVDPLLQSCSWALHMVKPSTFPNCWTSQGVAINLSTCIRWGINELPPWQYEIVIW